MELSLRHVEAGSDDYEYVADLYYFSFPEKEREKLENIMKVSKTPLGEFYVVLDGETRVGMLYMMIHKDLVYIYYLAIDPGKRSIGYGSAVLQIVFKMFEGYRFALNSEAPDDKANNNEERLERLSFYEKNGFKDTGTKTSWQGVDYCLLTYGGKVGKYETWKMFRLAEKYSKSD